ncbi:AsmA family protein [Pseudodesulfovibrio sp. zrk46]|uniref:AsmA family protein n=1 Tax=Pseudodesulfovibrio sp. zrk46 TaxID=2725288 RepID=UPI001448DE27|nr:AsmA family protein [Pseudodesulfovibrio sp. zrk46]QJB58117.1 hypothetical protein HFN16_17765 [Pseudodesulfovibrio sp. zrk46]
MKKYLLIGLGVLVVGIAAALIIGVSNLGPIIKTATEKFGPQITKTEVKLGSADVSIFSGAVSLDDFLLGNPKGFSMPSAVECDKISVKLDTDSLTTDTIVINEIYVDGPVISYEKKGNTDNFKTIVNNIKKTVASEKKADKKQDSAATEETGAEKKIVIENFIVKNGKINMGGSLLKAFGDDGVGISLPDIHLKDIGKDKETSPAEAFAIILGEMTGDVTGTVTQVSKQLQEQLGKAVDGVSEGAGKVGDTIKGLFGD